MIIEPTRPVQDLKVDELTNEERVGLAINWLTALVQVSGEDSLQMQATFESGTYDVTVSKVN